MRVTVFSVLAAGMSLFIVVGSNPVGVYNAGAAAAQSNTLVGAFYAFGAINKKCGLLEL